eukprot:SAG11_NODE_1001_length_6220_cov_6.550400_4_plen_87_part_00
MRPRRPAHTWLSGGGHTLRVQSSGTSAVGASCAAAARQPPLCSSGWILATITHRIAHCARGDEYADSGMPVRSWLIARCLGCAPQP